ncbi:MAG: GNAT family N-acetyltransferase [Rhizobiaceae bacterium]|nr:GNAT family N-acetyltransferase [Rhizobiaceae bacterium]MCV0405059.1 GNAT family N-acetyltransferase [Rhizobiaceae bacterium]
MDAISIRVAVPSDEAALTELIAASYRSLDDGSYESAKLKAALPFMSKANPTLLASGTYYIADIGGQIAGCGGWTREIPGGAGIIEGVGHIRHFATHPDHVRKGVAAALLRHCLAQATSAGIIRMMSQATLPAERFYEAAGFRRLRMIEVAMGPVTLPAIEMERALP